MMLLPLAVLRPKGDAFANIETARGNVNVKVAPLLVVVVVAAVLQWEKRRLGTLANGSPHLGRPQHQLLPLLPLGGSSMKRMQL